jgi:anti-anti-sigma factor
MAGSADAAAPTFEAAEDETSVSFTISSDMRLADRIVAESRHFLNRMGFETFSEFKLVLRELLINAIEHGNKSRADKQVACAIAMRPNAVFKITVSDQGEGFDHKALDMSIPKDSKQIRNRGYAIINAFSKKIEFNDAGNQVSAYVKVHQETRFDVSDEGGWTVIRPSGDITAAVADKFRTLLDRHADQGRTRFRFDFEKVQDLDSVGLSSFLILHKMLSDKGPELEIINVNKDLNHFFRMTRLDRIYAIRTSSKGDA